LEDLITIGFFVFAWLMAAAGSRKKQQERRRRQGLPETPPGAPEAGASRPSDDERPQRGRDLIPENIWEEIEALASGKPRPAPPAPKPSDRPAPPPALPEPSVPDSEPTGTIPVPRERGRVLEPRSRARQLPERTRLPRPREGQPQTGASTDLVPIRTPRALTRSAPVEVVAVEESTERRERPKRVGRTRAWLGLSDPAAARRAMILKEVLGPPLASRDPREVGEVGG